MNKTLYSINYPDNVSFRFYVDETGTKYGWDLTGSPTKGEKVMARCDPEPGNPAALLENGLREMHRQFPSASLAGEYADPESMRILFNYKREIQWLIDEYAVSEPTEFRHYPKEPVVKVWFSDKYYYTIKKVYESYFKKTGIGCEPC